MYRITFEHFTSIFSKSMGYYEAVSGSVRIKILINDDNKILLKPFTMGEFKQAVG